MEAVKTLMQPVDYIPKSIGRNNPNVLYFSEQDAFEGKIYESRKSFENAENNTEKEEYQEKERLVR